MYLPAPDESIRVAVLRLVLRLPGSQSLKDRRKVVLSFKDRVFARHHAVVAEVGHLENAQAAVLAVSLVGNDAAVLRSRMDAIRAEAETRVDALLVESSCEIFPFRRQE